MQLTLAITLHDISQGTVTILTVVIKHVFNIMHCINYAVLTALSQMNQK